MNNLKILYLDVESIGVNALKSDLGCTAVFGYKWEGDKRAKSLTLTRKELRHFDDKRLLKQASKLFAEADLIVGHFASVFDRRFIQGRLLINGLPPIPPTRLRDTCMIARSVANYSSNRLKHLCKILGFKNQKLENGWPMAWFRVMQGDMKALAGMARYCEGDIEALQELYHKLLPFDNAHPKMYSDRAKCGICDGAIQYRGRISVNSKWYRRFQCTRCSHWGRETKVMK